MGLPLTYAKQLKEQALARMMAPGNEPVAMLSPGLNVTVAAFVASTPMA
jgi:hypothetical protein